MTQVGALLPEHAYVPGLTARHAEGSFDSIRNSVVAGMSEQDLQQTQAFQTGLVYLEQGFFWEAHEVLEPVWMACDDNSAARQMVQGLIQLANAHLKVHMKRPRAVLRLCDIAHDHFVSAANLGGQAVLGQEVARLLIQVETLKLSAKNAI